MKFDITTLRPVLLVLDLQRLFTSADGPFSNPAAGAVIASVNGLAAACRAHAIPVVFSRYTLASGHGDAGLLAADPNVQQGFFDEDSDWMQFDDRLLVEPADTSTRRNRPGAFQGGELDRILAGLQSDCIILCGVSVNNAISSTAREAFARDLAPVVVRDATGAAPWETRHDIYFEILDNWTAAVMTATELLAALDS